MKINQEKIEKAVQVLEALQTRAYPGGFPNEMKGDISSFGASIIQAGLLPSVLFFCEGDHSKAKPAGKANQDEDTKMRRAQVMKAVFDVIELDDAASYSKERPLLDYVRRTPGNSDTLDNITESALAVKVAMRAFKFKEKGGNKASAENAKTDTP